LVGLGIGALGLLGGARFPTIGNGLRTPTPGVVGAAPVATQVPLPTATAHGSMVDGLPGGSLASPDPTRPAVDLAGLPACRFGDTVTTGPTGDYGQAILDTDLRLPEGYVPPDLVLVSDAGLAYKGLIRDIAIPDLAALANAARAAGLPLAVVSSYRSEARQRSIFRDWVRSAGEAAARNASARPGHSEHELGLAVDIGAEGGSAPWNITFDQTALGRWLVTHAWEFGFVQSYPKGAEARTCYAYEPWHYRWVGREVAAAVQASGVPLRAFLWASAQETP